MHIRVYWLKAPLWDILLAFGHGSEDLHKFSIDYMTFNI